MDVWPNTDTFQARGAWLYIQFGTTGFAWGNRADGYPLSIELFTPSHTFRVKLPKNRG